ncbi:MAG: hypothetical protein R6U68_16370 [Desulfobacteraceae bacterium]
MIKKQPLISDRIREIDGSFAWIGHRFLRQGFWQSLTHKGLLLYLFLVMVGDRRGISYYSFDKICSMTGLVTDDYILARNELIDKDLIAFDGCLFQVLSLPPNVKQINAPVLSKRDIKPHGPVSLSQLFKKNISGAGGENG